MALQYKRIMKTALNNIAKLSTGHVFRGRISDNEDGNVRVLQIRDIRARTDVPYERLPRLRWIRGKQDGQLQPGDVVMPARGDHYQAAIYRHHGNKDDMPVVATNQLFVIRPKDATVGSEYLCWYLNQPQAQRQIMTYRTVSTIPMLDRRSLARITVWVPPIDTQKKIVALHQTWQQEKKIYDQLITNRERMMQGLFQQILREGIEVSR